VEFERNSFSHKMVASAMIQTKFSSGRCLGYFSIYAKLQKKVYKQIFCSLPKIDFNVSLKNATWEEEKMSQMTVVL
jgi:hypothetical protein